MNGVVQENLLEHFTPEPSETIERWYGNLDFSSQIVVSKSWDFQIMIALQTEEP